MDNVIGIDIGYGQTKTFTSAGAKGFPTTVTSMVPEETFGKIRPIEINGEKFLVGDDAISKWVIDTRTTGFLGSNAWLAPLGLSLILNGLDPADVKEGHIVLGIPPGEYTKDEARKIINLVRSSTISQNGQIYDLRGADVSVIPQGAGIYFAYLSGGLDGTARDKNIAVVDIGHYTIDMVFFAKGKYIEDATSSIPMGVSLLLDDICAVFKRQHKWSINHQTAGKLLANGEITILQDVYRLEQMPTILQAYTDKVASLIDRFFEGLPEKPDIGIAGGGGVLALKGNIKLRHKFYIIPDPVAANARGYYHYGLQRKA
ncbi:MAG: ParM/StbA family protein [Syntrophales bacterium]